MRLDWYDGAREALRELFAEAEDSASQLDSYINDGRVLVAWLDDHPVGHLQLVPRQSDAVEVKNMAVAGQLRGRGIGRALLEMALQRSAQDGARVMVVATAAADIGNLRFYQRCGFRFSAIEQDVFVPDAGYPDGIVLDGIPLRDRVWLERPVPAVPGAP
jgi:ribosomal protein S18 acetylase RimI-like enzyme